MIFYVLFQWINSITAIPLSSYYDTDNSYDKLTQKERILNSLAPPGIISAIMTR